MKQTTTKQNDTERILAHITDSKDEILNAISERPAKRGRPLSAKNIARGPKDTRMMKIQRTALIVYVTVELHKCIEDVTLADAFHVWNSPENVEAWTKAARRKDARRGYSDHASLYSAVRTLVAKRKVKLAELNAV